MDTIRTSSFTAGLQLVLLGIFIMLAPIQLQSLVEDCGLIILPLPNMPVRRAGIMVRKSSLQCPAIQTFINEITVFGEDSTNNSTEPA